MASHETESRKLITNTNLVEYLQTSIHNALSHQNIEVEPVTAHYLVHLLSLFLAQRTSANTPRMAISLSRLL